MIFGYKMSKEMVGVKYANETPGFTCEKSICISPVMAVGSSRQNHVVVFFQAKALVSFQTIIGIYVTTTRFSRLKDAAAFKLNPVP